MNLRARVRSLTARARQAREIASRSPRVLPQVERRALDFGTGLRRCRVRQEERGLGTATALDEHQLRGRRRQRLACKLAHQIQCQMHVGRARGGCPPIAIAHHEPVGRHLDVRERPTKPVHQPPARRRTSAGQQARLREQHCAAAAARQDLRAAGHVHEKPVLAAQPSRLDFEVLERFAPHWRDDRRIVAPACRMNREPDAVRSANGAARSADDVAVEAGRGCTVAKCRACVVRYCEQLQQAGGDPGRAAWVTDDCHGDGFRHKGGKYDTGVHGAG